MVVDYWCTHTLDNNTNSHITLEFGLPRLVLSSFFSAEWFRTEFREFASIFVPRNGIPSCFFFRCSVRKGIQRDIFYFLLNGTEFRVLFSSAEGFGTEFRDFLFRGTAGIPSEITLCSVYSVFRGIIFMSEIPNPSYNSVGPANTGTTKDVYRRLCSTPDAAPKEGGRAHCEFMGGILILPQLQQC